MEKENFEILKERLKYAGFGDGLNTALEKKMKEGKPEFKLQVSMDMGEKKLDFNLNFKKSDKQDRYFFNSYDTMLTKPDGKQKSHTFYQNQNISAKEAFNLLEGRSVYKTLFNREGKRYQAWLQLDLGKQDGKGRHPMEQYHQKYGFDLEKALKKLPILQMDGMDEKDRLLYSLKKGNLHQIGLDGKEGNFLVAALPKYKSISIYEENGKRLKLNELRKELGLDSKKGQGQKKEKNQEPEKKKEVEKEKKQAVKKVDTPQQKKTRDQSVSKSKGMKI